MSSSAAERLQFRPPPINLCDDGSRAPSSPPPGRVPLRTDCVSAPRRSTCATMARALLLLLGVLRSACRSRADLMLENAALRHQLGVLTRAGRRPRVTIADRWFWVVLHRLWR